MSGELDDIQLVNCRFPSGLGNRRESTESHRSSIQGGSGFGLLLVRRGVDWDEAEDSRCRRDGGTDLNMSVVADGSITR
jgi:hypothetical protein